MADPIIGQISVGDGATFTPAVDGDGVISWSNNKNLPNPASVDIPQAVMDRYLIAPIASPAFTGNPTAPTQAKTDDSTKLATTAYVKAVAADYLALTGGSITGDVDITGDLSVSGAITGNLTGNVTGNADTATNATNDANGSPIAGTYLPLSGGTMNGNIAWTKGEIGYRTNTHTDPLVSCRQIIVTAGKVDSEWNDGNAKLALHTYSADNSSEDGSFNLLATDGTNNATLQGKPNGDLLWANKSVVTKKDETISFTMTTSNGSAYDLAAHKIGNIVVVYFAIRPSSNVGVGSSITGTFSGLPKNVGSSSINSASYVGATALILSATYTQYTVRVTGATLSSGSTFGINFMYATVS